MTPKKQFYSKQANTVIKKMEERNMEAYYCNTSNEAKTKALELMPKKSVISWGGSQTIQEIGLIDELRNLDYTLIDRSTANTPDEVRELYLKSFDTDYYLMSSNAITLDGKLINVDGNGNRLAALIYGPKNVIVIAGMNKVVADEQSALLRARNQAAPPNTTRLGLNTPCVETGKCHECLNGTICCNIGITRFSKYPKRIKVILVGEELGY